MILEVTQYLSTLLDLEGISPASGAIRGSVVSLDSTYTKAPWENWDTNSLHTLSGHITPIHI